MCVLDTAAGRPDPSATGREVFGAGRNERYSRRMKGFRRAAWLSSALVAFAADAATDRAPKQVWCGTARNGAETAVVAHREAAAAGRLRLASARDTSVDVGQIAVLQDDGDLALLRNDLDLSGAALRFTPAGGGYSVTRLALSLEPDTGAAVSLGDDDSKSVALPFSFGFYGRSYSSAFLNSDGNLTFGEGDSASTSRTVGRLISGPPRIAALLADLNLEAGGRLSTLSTGDHFSVTWRDVPQFDQTDKNTFQITLWSDGRIDFVYGTVTAAIDEAAVGTAPGGGGALTAVDFSAAANVSGGGALVEGFRGEDALDTVAVARKFYLSHSDDYQQLVIYTSRRLVSSNTFSFEQTVKNPDQGIGAAVADLSREYGSAGRLESFVTMDQISKYPDDLNQRFLGEDSALSVLGHEVGHRWLAQGRFRDGGRISDELLGRDLVHWSFFTDTDGSFMEGNDITDSGGSSFRTAGASLRYSPLDQYLMGLRPASEVPPFFFVRNPTGAGDTDPGRDPRTGVTFTGTRKDVTIDDVISALGARSPAPAPAVRAFRQAFVYVAVGGPADPAAIAKIERIRAAWPAFFAAGTDGRLAADPRLN